MPVGKALWTGSSHPSAPACRHGNEPPASANQSLRCCGPVRGPSTPPDAHRGTMNTGPSPKKLLLSGFAAAVPQAKQQLLVKSSRPWMFLGSFFCQWIPFTSLLVHTLRKLKQGKSVKIPVYDFNTHGRQKEWKTVYGASVIIFEGIMSFADKELLKLLDMKIFVDTDSDIRLVRRLRRDITERGRDIEGVIKQYNKFVKPAFEQYIEPTMRLADIVVPRGGGNMVAIDLIVQHVHSQLEERKLRWDMAALASAHQAQPLPQTLSVLESTPQVRGMHTIIRNKETSRDEFIFYSKRLMRLLIERARSFLPSQVHIVQTPQGEDYEGRTFHGKRITGVSILRAGETMEPALRAVCKDVRIGKILIQTNQDTGEPELHYLRLPKDISEDHVILMDCTVSTGAAAMMAIRVLLDHDAQEDKILLVSLLMAEMGVHSVAYAFPQVKIITTAVDKKVNDLFHIIPGIGNFGDRYFGTDAPPDWSDDDMDEPSC
ncbi:uridine-cytidine kinase-like 1 isoform X7 [Cyprinus carpio]|uniref:uridine/cytidine kinase n=1 Tax=Cyprinus carpio TaxID=7962 RepID=A0A9Q9VPA3_CYPCA|nr:uridine-cytidine kinase-like 1 isoform X7 [Cyprinus carpio]